MTRQASRPRALARGVLGLLVLVAACWGALLGTVPTPTGDPVLLAASPADGEIVKSPDEIRLTFDRPVPAGLATVHMTNPSGKQVVEGRPYNVSGDTHTLAVTMPPTRFAGTWSVAWSTPSSRLEPISGALSFDVSGPSGPVAVPQISTEPDPVVVAIHTGFRVAATAAFALGVGVAFVLGVVWPAGIVHAPARRVVTYAWWALVVATFGTIVSLGGYAARLPLGEAFDPVVVSAAFGSDIGAILLVRLLVLVPITVALVQLLTGPPAATAVQRWLRAGAVLGSAAALAATWSFAEPHGPDGPAPLAVGAEIALLLTVAICVGGPVLLWVLMRTAGDSMLRAAVPRLARVMPVCGGLLLVIAPITATGWQMIALLVLGVLVVGTGFTGRWWVRRRAQTRGRDLPGRARLRRLAASAAVGVAVALIAAAASAPGPAQLAFSAWQAGAP